MRAASSDGRIRPVTAELRLFLDALAADDPTAAGRLLDAAPGLARESLGEGASRADAAPHFVEGLERHAFAGDTALHFAAAAYRAELIGRLVAGGADVEARNRRGATALHYASVGDPRSPRWDPKAQAGAIAALIAAGADPNAVDRSGASPLHRAVRTRCAAAVQALLAGGADRGLATKNGSSPARLAAVTSGRSGSGSAEARAQQAQILRLLGER